MTDTKELTTLIEKAIKQGAEVFVEWEEIEGRRLYKSIRITGLDKVGHFPMSPISAAETLRLITLK